MRLSWSIHRLSTTARTGAELLQANARVESASRGFGAPCALSWCKLAAWVHLQLELFSERGAGWCGDFPGIVPGGGLKAANSATSRPLRIGPGFGSGHRSPSFVRTGEVD